MAGNSTIHLSNDYFPEVRIQLKPLPSVTLRGVVEDEDGRALAGARVSVEGYKEIATTDSMGNFTLPAHVADGQMVKVQAQKGDLTAVDLVPAGATAELVLRKR